MGQMFNYSWINCVISVNGVRFCVMRTGDSGRFEKMPGVEMLADTQSHSGQQERQTCSGSCIQKGGDFKRGFKFNYSHNLVN